MVEENQNGLQVFGDYYFKKNAQELLETVMVYDLPPQLLFENAVDVVTRGRYHDANGLLCELGGILGMLARGFDTVTGRGGGMKRGGTKENPGGSSHKFEPRGEDGSVGNPHDPKSWNRVRELPSDKTAAGTPIPTRPNPEDLEYGKVGQIAGFDKINAEKARARGQKDKDVEDYNQGQIDASHKDLASHGKAYQLAMGKIKGVLDKVAQHISYDAEQPMTPPASKDIYKQFMAMLNQFMQEVDDKLKFDAQAYYKKPDRKVADHRKPVIDKAMGDSNAATYDQRLAARRAARGK